MTMQFPFSESFFCDPQNPRTMVISRNVPPSNWLEITAKIVFSSDGSFSGGMCGFWTMENGVLKLTDQWRKLIFEFNGAETRNGTVFLTGEPYLEASKSGFIRCCLHGYQPLNDGFRICVTSHANYRSNTLPKLFRSLSRISFPQERVSVFIVGDSDQNTGTINGWNYTEVKSDFGVFSGLASIDVNYDGYWLFIHDTCEFCDDFVARMSKVDVGLKFDVILSANDSEIGLYHSDFIKILMANHLFENQSKNVLQSLIQTANLCCVVNGVSNVRHVQTKDVYGTGIMREVLYIDELGLKKFRRIKGAPAKP